MIISASYRTDIPAFYGDWFRRRWRDGVVRVRNPYGGPPSLVPLRPPEVDGYVFWTRNAGPFLAALSEVADTGVPFVVQFTVTGYPRALDAATIPPERAIAQIASLVRAFGAGRVVWRYDPIVCSDLTPAEWHLATFARLAGALEGLVDEVVVSWLQVYRKTRRNLDLAARASGFVWEDPPADAKRALLSRLAELAAARGIRLVLCDQPELRADGVGEARCIDAGRLARLAGRPITVPLRSHRATCGCFASRDIGAYDTCPHGCVYCYAVASRATAKRRFAAHDPEDVSLG